MIVEFNIRELRQSSGLTLVELAKKAGVSFEAVRTLETRNEPKRVSVLVDVLEALGFELSLSAVEPE